MINLICKICKKYFQVIPHRQNTAKYCSQKCFDKSKKGRVLKKRKQIQINCVVCKNIFSISKCRLGIIKTCSPECRKKWRHHISYANNNSHWKGGQYKEKDGYILVYNPNHPFAIKRRYVKRSRLVVEKCFKRFLKSTETIHHINGIKNDDRPENLYLFKNEKEHQKFHWFMKKNPLSKIILTSNTHI